MRGEYSGGDYSRRQARDLCPFPAGGGRSSETQRRGAGESQCRSDDRRAGTDGRTAGGCYLECILRSEKIADDGAERAGIVASARSSRDRGNGRRLGGKAMIFTTETQTHREE